ncbi:MAG: type II/IV secretion system protein [Candidatus Colwellbacteria bacterium]|nr:type II/IV secretion system protein [Candidatus Colwellbacteria bacterium]
MRLSRDTLVSKITSFNEAAEERDARRRAQAEGFPYLNLAETAVDSAALLLLTEEEERQAKAIPIEAKKEKLTLAIYSSLRPELKELLGNLKTRGYEVNLVIASLKGLESLWARYLKEAKRLGLGKKPVTAEAALTKSILDAARTSAKTTTLATDFISSKKEGPTSQLVEAIFASALVLGASDVHLEPHSEGGTSIRFRIDGLLKDVNQVPAEIAERLTSRIKLFAKLKLNVTDSPQDGRFTVSGDEGEVEVRASVVPAEFGEAVVMRILDPRKIVLTLKDLGFRSDDEKVITAALARPNGMVLVTGPTGSGKTTTLYAFLAKVKTPALKIITVEDPIEYHLSGIEQTEVDLESGYTFVAGLRSILRQDPDIILVGEIRDLETAETAIHAALTGHLVFSTLHTNNASGAIPRLVDLGVKPGVIGPALIIVIAQRLVRRLCPYCREELKIEEPARIKIEEFLKSLPERVSGSARSLRDAKIYEPGKGCNRCEEGYRGQVGIFELFESGGGGTPLDLLMKEGATESEIEQAARKKGMVTMQEDGVLKALQGVTSLEEVIRASGPIGWFESQKTAGT